MSFGNRLRSLRGPQSQAAFGKLLGISQSAVANYERGERNPDTEFLKLVCGKFEVSADWLLFGQSSPLEKEKTANALAVFDGEKSQHAEIIESEKNKSPTVGGFSEKLDLALGMLRDLQPRMLSMMDEIAALREERAELRAEVKRLETELQRYKNGELPLFNAPGASAARKSRPGSEDSRGGGPLTAEDMPPPKKERQGGETRESDKGE